MSSTHGKLHQQSRRDLALAPVSLASSNATGPYMGMAGYEKALFPFYCAAVANAATVVAQVMKATDKNGTGGTALTDAEATITGSARAKKALLTGNTIADGDTVVDVIATLPNGDEFAQTFTCEDTDPDIDAGQYASGANDTAACVELAAAINHLLGDYIKATPSTSTVILEPVEQANGDLPVISLENAHATIVPSTLNAEGFVEIDASQLGEGYTHVALKLTTTGTIVVFGELVRGGGQAGSTVPNVAASTVL